MTHFDSAGAARRYAAARPDFHPTVVPLIARRLGGGVPVERALDVGCGTGRSTAAVRALAERAVGVDRSPAMLAWAPRHPGVGYAAAAAERLPFDDGAFGLVTVALAFHWFDRDRFLAEAHRVLGAAGWLVIYDNAFAGEIVEAPAFARWSREVYLGRFPSPPRDRRPLTAAAGDRGFDLVGQEAYSNEVAFTAESLVAYLMTQSNVIAAIEREGAAIAAWLRAEIGGVLPDGGTGRFRGSIHYLRKARSR